MLPGLLFEYIPKQLPYVGSNAQDLWGFYNGNSYNTNLLIYNINGNVNTEPTATYGADRTVNASFVDAGMISKITYPTGGYSRFVFEPNQYFTTLVGGLRIKRIVSVDNFGNGVTKSFNYFDPLPISNLYSTSMDAMGLLFKFDYSEFDNSVPPSGGTRRYNTYYENFSFQMGTSSGARVTFGCL